MYQRLPKVLLFLLVPVYAVCLFAPSIGQMHDDGIYLASARALANGAGYVVDSLPNAIPQTKYPILYPAIIALFWKFSGDLATVAFLSKLISVCATAGWVYALRILLRRRIQNSEIVNWVVFVSLSAPWAVYLSTSVLPDTLFACLSTFALAMLLELEEEEAPKHPWKIAVGVAILAASAFLIRTTGLALLLAAFISLTLRRKSLGLIYLSVAVLICGPWLLWQASQSAPIDEVQLYYSKLSYARGHLLAGFGIDQMITIVLFNAVMLSTFFSPATHFLPAIVPVLAGGFIALFSVRGWLYDVRNRIGILNIWATLYIGILISWIWPPHRYVVPLLPIALMYAALGIQRLRGTPNRLWSLRIGLTLFGGFLVVANGASAYYALKLQNPSIGWTKFDDWSSQVELTDWIRTQTPENAIIAANLDPAVYLLSGRKSIRLFRHMPYELFYVGENGPSPVGDVDDIRRHLRKNKVTHVVLSPMKNYKEREPFWKVFDELQRSSPRAFLLRKRLAAEGFAIYEIDHVNL